MNIGLPAKKREEVAVRLQELLCNEFVLYVKTLNYHWHITGGNFAALHEFLEDQYQELFQIVDDVAERCIALGYQSPATLKEFIKESTIKEKQFTKPEPTKMLEDLVSGHEIVIQQLREDITFITKQNDHATTNLLSNVIEKHEKMLWMIRSHLQ